MIAIKIKTKIPNRKAKHIAMGEIDYRDDRGKTERRCVMSLCFCFDWR